MNKGFSLAEVIIAIFVTIIGIIGAMSLITYSISNVAIGKSQIIAASLAQEGMEVVRNIRDTNWIEGEDWDDGLINGSVDCSSGCRVQYDSLSLMSLSGNPVLQIDSNGFYQYSTGTNTRFSREIIIIDDPDDDSDTEDIKVISKVTWKERDRDYEIKAENRLYDWK